MNYWKGQTFAVFLESNLVVPIKNQIALQSIYTKKTILYICNSKKEEWKLLLEPSKEKWKVSYAITMPHNTMQFEKLRNSLM